MSRVWSMMDTGKRSMMNSQTALQTVSHNIANKNVEGYSRQDVKLQTAEPTGYGQLRIGNGAKVVGINRTNNPFIEKQVEKEGSQLGNKTAQAEMMMRVEQVFNEQINKGLNKFMGEFFNAYREMANSPENLSLRSLVKESADFLANNFQHVNGQLTSIQGEADFEITTEVAKINSITREISQLNQKIMSAEIGNTQANDERDRREQLVKELSEKVNIRYAESKEGVLAITIGNNGIVVSGGEQRDLYVSPSAAREGKREGNVEIYYKATDTGTPVNLTQQLTGGKLGGLLYARDEYINDTLDKLDELAFNFADGVNEAHLEGYDRFNNRGGVFFEIPNEQTGAASQIRVSDRIQENVGYIVASAQPNSPADNRVANVISSLQYKKMFENGESTIDDFYGNIVGNVGINANRANSELESQKGIVAQLKNIRESISGVSLDEETTKMIEFQKLFDASARLIRTADQMMDTVLALKQM